MSSREVEDDKRQYQCSRKFEKMVKQFDELIEMMGSTINRPPNKWRKTSREKSNSQGSNDKVITQTITRFLHEMDTITADRDCTPSSDE